MNNTKWQLLMAMAAMVAGCGNDAGVGMGADGGLTADADVAQTPDIAMVPGAVCGDEVLDESEPCDGELLGGATCDSEGFVGGTIDCLSDCRGLDLRACTVAPFSETKTLVVPLPITDDAYDGTIESMACVEYVVPEGTRGFVGNEGFRVTLGINHSFLGDLVVKVVAPSGHVSTMMHRPGLVSAVDDGSGLGGRDANLAATHPVTLARGIGGFISEAMGSNLTTGQAPCRDNIYCNYVGTSPVGPDEISREPVAGTWQVCVGDAGAGDAGSIVSAALELGVTTTPEDFVNGGEVLVTEIPDGAYDGTKESMACRTFDASGLDDVHHILNVTAQFAITHPNAGDLIFALATPDGELHALGARPGVDEAPDGSGAALGAVANVVPSPRIRILAGDTPYGQSSIEALGADMGTDDMTCQPDWLCGFLVDGGNLDLAPIAEVLGTRAAGSYELCVGDARPGDAGTFTYGVLSFGLAP